MVDLNWLLVLLGFGAKGAPNISDNTKAWNHILLLTIVIAIWWLLCHLAEDRETNPNVNEVDDELGEILEHPNGELDHYFDEDGHHWAAVPGDDADGRHGGCSICGNFSTTRCARCKAARYCSAKCQIIHWRSGHKYECSESETAADEARPTHDHGTSKLVEKSEMENISNGSNVDDGVEWNPKSNVVVEVSNGNDVNKFHGCEICSSPSTTRCSRCKSVKYCSLKCLIMDWKWHKDHCIARFVDSARIERPRKDVGLLKNSYEEEENIRSSGPLSLVFHPEGTTSFNSPVAVSHSKSELDEWKNRANFAREKFQSLKREYNYQLLVLKNEKESIAEAETRACNVIHSLNERLTHLQNVVQENIAEKRKLEEDLQNLECECSNLKKQLQEEHKCAQRLTTESNKSREVAQIAMREVEVVRQALQEEREQAQRVKENLHRDVIFLESRATFAEEKLSDLYRKIRMSDYKVCSICLSNEKDLAFGCGHMTCRDCGSKLSKCPICREQITNHIKLFPG